jgi:CubicO group peptidase (beta-lactamase class C family)
VRMDSRNKLHPLLMLLLVITALLMPFTLASGAAGSPEAYPGLAALAQQRVNTLINDYGVTSVQYAVISRGNIVLSGNAGVYSRTEDRPITADTMYGIGSTSKAFTTASVMLLVDRGLIDLDAPVTTYIPEFTLADPRYTEITVRMLLNHSSGLMGSTFPSGALFNDGDTVLHDRFIDTIADQRLKAAPGEFSVYCNDGFTLAELLVERVSGMSFTDFIKANITDPLGMNHTATPQSEFDRSSLARTYADVAGGSEVIDSLGVIGSGGIYSTAEDLCKFAGMFMDEPGYVPARGMLSSQSRNAMTAEEYEKGIWPEPGPSIFNYGLGWDSVHTYPFANYGIQAIAKGGDTQYYHATLLILPAYDLAAALVSSGGTSTYNLITASELLQHVLRSEGVLTAARPEVPGDAPVAVPMPPTFMAYSGLYGSATVLNSVDIFADGRLTIATLGDDTKPPETLVYVGDGVFASADGIKRMNFVTESNGHTYIRRVAEQEVPGLGPLALTDHFVQKLAPVGIDEATLNAWYARDGVSYYPVSEKFSSQGYAQPDAPVTVGLSKEQPGYVGTLQIIDANRAVSPIQIPGMNGRDLIDLTFHVQDGVEYVKAVGVLYMSEKSFAVLATDQAATYTIGPDGHGLWYRIVDAGNDKTIIVNMPEQASFAVYAEGKCIDFSWITGHREAQLPAEGLIMFVGAPGTVFEVSFGTVTDVQ